MKTYHKISLIFLLSIFSCVGFAQNKDDAKSLVKQGIVLNDAGKYDEAIAKYNEAIKVDPNYATAYYEMGYTLFSTGKGKNAMPYLEKVLQLDPKSGGAYDMIGSIYDDDKQMDKAIEYFQKGLKVDPGYQRLYYNLAIMYYRLGKYPESEANAVSAIKLDPKHASSQRIYAMATYSEDKRGVSLLAWSSFLLLEPQTKRSVEAFNYIRHLLNYGIKRDSAKNVQLSISSGASEAGNMALSISVLAATVDKKGLTGIDSLKLELKSAYSIAGNFNMNKQDSFYSHFYADYFTKLASTDNMEAFIRLISLTAYREENIQWFKDNSTKLSALEAWVGSTKREF